MTNQKECDILSMIKKMKEECDSLKTKLEECKNSSKNEDPGKSDSQEYVDKDNITSEINPTKEDNEQIE